MEIDEKWKKNFLQANARREFICAEFTDVLRDLIRAVAMESEPSSVVYRATERMGFVAELLERAKEKITYNDLFESAVDDLRDFDARTDKEALITGAAPSGMSFIAEYTCIDTASKARISQRKRSFLEAIKYVSEIQGRPSRRRLR